jgi:hypothetical protein
MISFNRHRTAYCSSCWSERTFRKPNPQHGYHAVVTVLTLGLWLIPWAAATIHWVRSQPWRCRRCRSVLRENRGLTIAPQVQVAEALVAASPLAESHGAMRAVSHSPNSGTAAARERFRVPSEETATCESGVLAAVTQS